MQKKLKDIFEKAIAIIREYPLVLVMALLAAVSLICMTQSGISQETEFLFGKISLVFSLGISLSFALNMVSQRIGKFFLLQLSGILFLLFFYFLLPNEEKNFTEQYAFLIVPTFILSHLLVSFIAFFGQKKELNFWQYNKNLFINIFLTVVFTGVLIAGIQLAIVAVDQLFDFKFNNSYYKNPFIVLSVFGSCFIFLLFNVNGLLSLEKDEDYPQILKFFTQFILIPLLLIYVIILYFYSAKILLSWELPKGWVSYLVLAYSIVGIFALLLVHPLKEDRSKSWVQLFNKIFYFTLIPLLVLLFTAIFTRILQYGYTEARYFVLLLAVWLLAVVVYFIFKVKATIKFVPISLFCFGLFALAFPFLNSFSVAKNSQKKELYKILAENKLLEKGKINFNLKVPDSVATEISDKFLFLAKRQENLYLKNLLNPQLAKKFEKENKKGNFYETARIVKSGFKNITAESIAKGNLTNSKNIILTVSNLETPISDYDHLFKAYNYRTNIFKFKDNLIEINLQNGQFKPILFFTFNGKVIDLMPEIKTIFNDRNESGEFKVDDLSIYKTVGKFNFKLIFDNISKVQIPGKKPEYYMNSESILILVKEN